MKRRLVGKKAIFQYMLFENASFVEKTKILLFENA